MNNQPEPVVLDLAPLPRDKIGPFLILGVEKDAARDHVEASWARRLIGARKNQVHVSLEDINWAKEIIVDPDKRPRADAASLNLDLLDGVVRRIVKKFGAGQGATRPTWRPLDVEKSLLDCGPQVELPDWKAIRDAIEVPQIPEEMPAVETLLTQLVQEPLDPWTCL